MRLVSTAVHADVNRRDFLMIATGAVAGVGAALTAWPFISQMNPDASVLALSSVEVDLAPIAEGQSIIIKWRGNPLIVRHRSKADIEAAKAVKLTDLIDNNPRNANAKGNDGATDDNRVVGGKEQYLVMLGVCTHLGWEIPQLAAGCAHAMVRNMIRQAACAGARHQRICQCHLTFISPTQKSASAKGTKT
jgi:ubiquinol-cytochrome c reductase iron-sulfur subunit